MSPITMVIADDHDLMRVGMRTTLEQEPEIEVVAEAQNGLETIELVNRLQPDILVADLMMPKLNGFEVCRRVWKLSPQTKTIIISMHSSEAYVAEAFEYRAWAYVLKISTSGDLVEAVRAVRAERRFISSGISEVKVFQYQESLRKSSVNKLDVMEKLTPREKEVFVLIANGLSNNEVAEHLCISVRTVESHRQNLMSKLGLKSKIDLVQFAISRGIIPNKQL